MIESTTVFDVSRMCASPVKLLFGVVVPGRLIVAVVSTLAGGLKGTNVGFADGAALTQAQFCWPHHAIADLAGNVLVADDFNQRVRRIAPNSGTRLSSALGW